MGARSAFVKVNTDAAYRAKFLKDPVGVLGQEGITLSAKDQKQLLDLVESVKKNLPNLGRTPTGYDDLIDAIAEGKLGSKRADEMLIV
ncbi:MAG TPA: hypothetical protein VKF39_00250 [Nitrososphaerales archaeon]|nr:hypothetical protein [Nitrososphaerales archaeon]